ncbi:hypothetical protein CEXT_624041 [Caerostris extrusa]|uniref:Uncharacterized protein n=1 Tax=Caerostris extrusa TaxID=172846 RepID=A0AAV4RMS3_CAEEX|nr:hypothetical protein CEXT_624041 [Caerostris extrusa]
MFDFYDCNYTVNFPTMMKKLKLYVFLTSVRTCVVGQISWLAPSATTASYGYAGMGYPYAYTSWKLWWTWILRKRNVQPRRLCHPS